MAPLSEIRLKRFAHKRACHFRGTMVELILVNDDDGPITRYWGDIEFRWLAPLATVCPASNAIGPRPIATVANLQRYRTLHKATQPWRWRDPASLVA